MNALLLECISVHWTPEIGDPTIFGWLTVLLYLVAAGLSFARARDAFAAWDDRAKRRRVFWLVASAALVALSVNKQLDLQSLATATVRCLAFDGGWYDSRAVLQRVFIVSFLIAILALAGLATWYFKVEILRYRRAALGFFLLIFFVMVRAVSFHAIDALINAQLLGLRLNWILEMGALILIISGARRAMAQKGSD